MLSTELNSLATAGYAAASSARGSDGTGNPLYADFILDLAATGLDPTVYTLAELYLLSGSDGSTYPDAPASTNPASQELVGVFIGGDNASAKVAVLRDILLPPCLFKILIKNVSGDTWHSSGNTVRIREHNLLST